MFINHRFFILTIILASVVSCTENLELMEENPNSLFKKINSEKTNIDFENTITNTKDLNIFKYRNFYNGGGVGIGDINNDGFSDIVFTANQGANKVYLNEDNFEFKDITETAGMVGKNKWSTGVIMVDINADNWLDIYVCNAGNVEGDNQKNELYINNQDLTFTEAAEAYNLADNGFTTHATFFDYDNDGDLDVYLLNNSFVPVNSLGYSNKRELRSKDWKVKEILKGGGDKLLRNDNNYFTDVSEAAGIYGSLIGFGLGIAVADINNDQWQDIYVCNDFFERDYLYINNKDGTFSEEIESWAPHISLSSMGADLSDINNDGMSDIFVCDMLVEENERLKETTEFERYDLFQLKQTKQFHKQYMQNTLQLNNGNNSFSEIAHYAGVAATDWSWGALLFDMDNDGYKDIFVTNGIYHDLTNQDFMDFFADDILDKMVRTGKKVSMDTIVDKMPSTPIDNYAFKNNGDLTFSNVIYDWGFNEPSFSNGAAYGDLDNDGDLDLVINNVNQPALIYRNETNNNTDNSYLKIKLTGKENNTFAIGSEIYIYTANEMIHQHLQPSRGFQSSVDYVLTFGTGKQTKIDSVVVRWYNNSYEIRRNIPIDTLLVFDIKDAENIIPEKKIEQNKKMFTQQKNTPFEKQEENNYVDFDYEGLIYKMLSKEGPVISVADIDKNGLDDLFIGAPKGQAAKIYLQKNDGFYELENQALIDDFNFEDTAAAFFDANGDGHVDLLVGSGGNQTHVNVNAFDLRLYLNDGQGKFLKSNLEMYKNYYNTSIIAPYDFDLDGDIDVFVGSRSIPGIYGMKPKHFLLENDGKGNFTNQQKEKIPELEQLAMLTDALWKDMDKDGTKDLILTEDWGSVHIFKTHKNAQLKPWQTNLDTLNGWWKTVEAEDIDKDGNVDLILGNRGTNSIYKADSSNVPKMYVNDFDYNSTIEQVFTTMVNDRDVPVHLKRELTNQLPALKKNNLKFSDYAKKSITELFNKNRLEGAIKKAVNISESVLALNNGDQTFHIKKLPAQAQFSCINTMELFDLNKDGNTDIIYGGNDYGLKPQFAQLDASFGGVLLGNGKGNFEWIDYSESGFFIEGVINSIKVFQTKKERLNVIVGINNEQPLLYQVSQNY